jgi:hypothetical protein
MGQQWQKLLLEQMSDEASPPANPARNK